MRSYILLLAGIVAVAGGGMAFIYWVTADEEPTTPVGQERAPEDQQAASPLPAPTARVVPDHMNFRQPEAPVPPVVVSPAPPKPAPGTWGAVPAVSRAKALGATAGPMGRGLAELAPLLAACYGGNVQKMDDSSDLPTLVLSLETGVDNVTVVDAVPMTDGGATDQLFACAVRVVKGRTFPAPGVKPGKRQRLIHPIAP